ncbi:MAG: LysE/ArgO family amino acid transporter [Rubrivivax sp.]
MGDWSGVDVEAVCAWCLGARRFASALTLRERVACFHAVGAGWAQALAGALFLAFFGWQAVQRARRSASLQAGGAGATLSRRAAMAQAAAFTVLNPHVYLDTVLLMGGIGAQHAPGLQGAFIAGARATSVGWFTALGYGARWLAPWFARPRAWQILDDLIALTMFILCALLLRHVFTQP